MTGEPGEGYQAVTIATPAGGQRVRLFIRINDITAAQYRRMASEVFTVGSDLQTAHVERGW